MLIAIGTEADDHRGEQQENRASKDPHHKGGLAGRRAEDQHRV
jgi:hypothetical protein